MATKVAAPPSTSALAASKAPIGDGLKAYYTSKIEELELAARDKAATLRRLEAQRNELNSKGRMERKTVGLLFFRALSLPAPLLSPRPLALAVALSRAETQSFDAPSIASPKAQLAKTRQTATRDKELDAGRASLSRSQSPFFSLSSLSFSLTSLFFPPPLSPNNETVRLLREELQLLQEPGSYVGEVIKVGEGMESEERD